MKESSIAYDCRYFLGDRPCFFHKQEGVQCQCDHYEKVEKKILIIKLGAMGDVIRTTPLLRGIREEMPHAKVYWLTEFPEVLPQVVDVKLKFDFKSVLFLENSQFDIIYNLDKELEACALMRQLNAPVKKGFTLNAENQVSPMDHAAFHKFHTGMDDVYCRKNQKSYVQEILELCSLPYKRQPYWLEVPKVANKGYIGLNTGCGDRWRSRLWPKESWAMLARLLRKEGHQVLLLGGEAEHVKNLWIQEQSEADYQGHFPLEKFQELVASCELVVTTVTMALHLAIGFQKKVVLLNHIFNKYEFDLYDQGVILEPKESCGCFYEPNCPHDSLRNITPEVVFQSIKNLKTQVVS